MNPALIIPLIEALTPLVLGLFQLVERLIGAVKPEAEAETARVAVMGSLEAFVESGALSLVDEYGVKFQMGWQETEPMAKLVVEHTLQRRRAQRVPPGPPVRQ